MARATASASSAAETASGPIQLRTVEPAIGGIEVGVIGAFTADTSHPDAFVKLTV
jgi:hypothetical protein